MVADGPESLPQRPFAHANVPDSSRQRQQVKPGDDRDLLILDA